MGTWPDPASRVAVKRSERTSGTSIGDRTVLNLAPEKMREMEVACGTACQEQEGCRAASQLRAQDSGEDKHQKEGTGQLHDGAGTLAQATEDGENKRT